MTYIKRLAHLHTRRRIYVSVFEVVVVTVFVVVVVAAAAVVVRTPNEVASCVFLL